MDSNGGDGYDANAEVDSDLHKTLGQKMHLGKPRAAWYR
jgi:hypothetical protein